MFSLRGRLKESRAPALADQSIGRLRLRWGSFDAARRAGPGPPPSMSRQRGAWYESGVRPTWATTVLNLVTSDIAGGISQFELHYRRRVT